MTTRQKTPGSPFLYDSVTGDLVGLKDDHASQTGHTVGQLDRSRSG